MRDYYLGCGIDMVVSDNLISTLDAMMEIQLKEAVKDDEYMRGMYNGMEFVRTLILPGTEPVYVDKDGNLDSAAKARCPERYL